MTSVLSHCPSTSLFQQDNGEEYEAALPLYMQSLEYFLKGLKYETNPSSKEVIKARAANYIARAEELKTVISRKTDT